MILRHLLGCCLAAALTATAGPLAAQCLMEVEKTIDLMQQPAGGGGKPKGAEQDGTFETKQGTQSSTISESWQGGTQSQDGIIMSKRPAYNKEAAKYLGLAADLARAGKEGGCWQLLVQGQRILALIPADTPLPPTVE